ncbi:NAD-dependent epimerase/dehydratase family protein [Nocardia sp. CDC160]|uniref:NAD-dependent epimerase/dehydratase family protein n=1 Tax=Nocardia sp. CDC160 TaxID=3112166 RepID=UPI002DB92849|nr:NAD-dependent epimerase/dehydratase family protein [Nocardia sp. CDC160]MEC3916789.1 NAD-dependent epimerase/dehydratase family protein [Nocardia sp. CDC160]
MRILLIGASGYLGTAVSERLLHLGHEVVALVRPEEAEVVGAYECRIGDLLDPPTLTAAVTPDIDAVIDVATPLGDQAADAAAIAALTAPLVGTGRGFVYTSGVWVLGATEDRTADEQSPVNAIEIVRYRPAIERQVLALADEAVRATVIRPGLIYGHGGGIPALLVDLARKFGAPRIVGDLGVRWPMVYIEDLADLYVRVVTNASADTLWHGVAHPAVAVKDLVAAAGAVAGVTTEPVVWPVAEAAAELGAPFAEALALDQSVSGAAARDRLGWRPDGPTPIVEMLDGSYR